MPTADTHFHAATVDRIIDADTYEVTVDLDFRLASTLPLRLAHVDAPERATPDGKTATALVASLMGALPAPVIVRTYKPVDKFGRYLADVFVQGESVAEVLLGQGLAKPYEGGKK